MRIKAFKLIFITILIFTSLTVLSGCGSKQEETVNSSKIKEIHLIKDHLGRKVEVPVNPQRVLALNPNVMEVLFSLGVTPVGKVNEYTIERPEFENLPNVSLQTNPNIEMINKLAPDLIFAHIRHHGQILETLEDTGAAVVFFDPAAGDPLVGGIDLIGEAVNREKRAKEYMNSLKEKAAYLRKKIEPSSIETAVVLMGGNRDIRVAQPHCFWGSIMSRLGIENIVEEVGSSKPGFIPFDIETIVQKDPDLLIILQPGFKGGNGKGKRAAQKQPPLNKMTVKEIYSYYKNEPMWNHLTAVKENRIIILPIKISPGKINARDALEETAKLIYPDGFQ